MSEVAARGMACPKCKHQLDGIEWENILDYIYRHLLVSPDRLETVCKADHIIRTAIRRAL